MIDWQKVNIEDFHFELDAGEVRELGDTIVFPVKVKDLDGRVAFTKAVVIRADFYAEFRAMPDWKNTLWTIFRNRIQEDILARKKKSSVSVEDKVELMFDPQSMSTDRLELDNPNSQP